MPLLAQRERDAGVSAHSMVIVEVDGDMHVLLR
jgi:hypothetical protein